LIDDIDHPSIFVYIIGADVQLKMVSVAKFHRYDILEHRLDVRLDLADAEIRHHYCDEVFHHLLDDGVDVSGIIEV